MSVSPSLTSTHTETVASVSRSQDWLTQAMSHCLCLGDMRVPSTSVHRLMLSRPQYKAISAKNLRYSELSLIFLLLSDFGSGIVSSAHRYKWKGTEELTTGKAVIKCHGSLPPGTTDTCDCELVEEGVLSPPPGKLGSMEGERPSSSHSGQGCGHKGRGALEKEHVGPPEASEAL